MGRKQLTPGRRLAQRRRQLLGGAGLLGWSLPLGAALATLQLACVESVETDPAEQGPTLEASRPPVAEFDPAQRVVPLPNSLLIDPATGRVNVPPSCGEEPGSSAERLRLALNQLDGFGTSRMSLVATFSAAVDVGSTPGHVFLVRLAEHGVPLPRFEGLVPVDVVAGGSQRFADDCSGSETVPNLTLLPRSPLRGGSTYAVLLTSGIQSANGEAFEPSATWALVRQAEAPVRFTDPGAEALPEHNATPFDPSDPEDLASLHGLDTLWRAHAPLLSAVDQLQPAIAASQPSFGGRDDILLAWAFQTQTIGTPLDPEQPGSAAQLASNAAVPLVLPPPLAGEGAPLSVEAFFANAIPGVPCSQLGCDAIASIYAASPASAAPSFTSSSFLQGDDCTQPGTLAASFDDPAQPGKVCERQLPLLIVLPRLTSAAGFPTVIFSHGITRSKEDLLAIAGTLARGGFASVAVDAVDHGTRAVRTSTDAALGCDGAGPARPCASQFGPVCAPQCFAPILSPDLPRTRDHLRQTVLDQLALEAALTACAEPGACGALRVDAQRIGYLGQSLGSLLGGVTVAQSSSISAAELNVGAADWVQVLVDSGTPAIRCPLVDGLISAGVLGGQSWNGGTNPNATCLGDDWKTDPGFLQFAAAARWILDPIDPVNYADRYADRRVLLAEVVGDAVIPNSATLTFGTALGLLPEQAERATPDTVAPSTAVLGAGSHWVRYEGIGADPASQFPGNAYAHGSLLDPADPGPGMVAGSGELGTLRMQLDALGFFASHLLAGGVP
ncbi:MAG TPA: hypothetical protein VFS67_01485 [Polyangiaceae bacterium]|nr:hypothetical protein [Polyangiaceae bacterium]